MLKERTESYYRMDKKLMETLNQYEDKFTAEALKAFRTKVINQEEEFLENALDVIKV